MGKKNSRVNNDHKRSRAYLQGSENAEEADAEKDESGDCANADSNGQQHVVYTRICGRKERGGELAIGSNTLFTLGSVGEKRGGALAIGIKTLFTLGSVGKKRGGH